MAPREPADRSPRLTSEDVPGGSVPGPPLASTAIGHGPRVVLAHGFTQTGRVWNGLDRLLATEYEVVRVDLPGHGGSSHIAADLIEGAHVLGRSGGRSAYLGYSMGARFCLHLALARPDLVTSLVLISGTAGLDDAEERADRRAHDEAMADELDPVDGPDHTAGIRSLRQARVDEFLDRWVKNPLFARIATEATGMDERRRNTGPGLASSLRLAGTGTQQPLWPLLGRLSMPVLVVTGALDEKFTALGRRLVDAIGSTAHQVVIADAGHAPHLQRPDAVADAVLAHLKGRPANQPTVGPDRDGGRGR